MLNTMKKLFSKIKEHKRVCRIFGNIRMLMENDMNEIKVFLPSLCIGAFLLLILSGYTAPEAREYDAASAEGVNEEVTAVSTTAAETDADLQKKKGSFDLADGHYTGTGIGYGGEVKVDVTIVSKEIAAIEIVSAPLETDSFFSRAKSVIAEMIDAQSTDVDVVSGATYSSNGIIAAVKNALTGEKAEGTTADSVTGKGSTSVSAVRDDAEYKDGTYTGSAQGFGGTIKVEVTIKDGSISKINVLEAAGEGASYLTKAKTLLSVMIKKQTTNVDTVSGATYSSVGLIKAVRNALSKAKITKKKNSGKKNTSTEKKEDTTSESPSQTPGEEGKIPYIDGTYSGTGTGYRGDITVELTIKNHTITGIAVTKTSDDDAFFSKAKNILSAVVSQQDTKVDAVSGATYSSEGILEAIENALKEAKKATEQAAGGDGSNGADSSNEKNDSNDDNAGGSSESGTESTSTQTPEDTTEKNLVYQDGTYSVSVSCKPDEDHDFEEYTLGMDVTIKNDKITSVSNMAGGGNGYDSGNDYYVKRAANGTSKIKGVVTQILENGNASGIDAVSGATCTSKSIIEGCQKALKNAETGK